MKPLIEQTKIEKARLFHSLFPAQIRGFLGFTEQAAKNILNNPDNVKDNWGGKPLTADVWIELAKDVHERIEKNREELVKRKTWFSDQLFDGYTAMFTIQCLQDYTLICPDSRFNKAIELFFDV